MDREAARRYGRATGWWVEIWARRVGFAAAVLWMLVLPAARDIWGEPPWARSWHMYEGHGTEVCQVEYYEIRPSGRAPIDRLAVLSPQVPPPMAMRWLKTPSTVSVQGARLCRLLEARDVRAKARCGTRDRWNHLEETNLCRR